MSEPAGDQFSWVCPSCGRRVPTRFEECRCGFQRQALPPVVAEEVTEAPERRGPSPMVIVILVAAVGLGGYYFFQSRQADLYILTIVEYFSQRKGNITRIQAGCCYLVK